jgi:uncharacterized protein (DUF433 family)
MHSNYIDAFDGQYRVAGTRVSLESLVLLFHEGLSPESMVESYDTLTLEQVFGALAFYLQNQAEVDARIASNERRAALLHEQSRYLNADLISKLRRVRYASQIPS